MDQRNLIKIRDIILDYLFINYSNSSVISFYGKEDEITNKYYPASLLEFNKIRIYLNVLLSSVKNTSDLKIILPSPLLNLFNITYSVPPTLTSEFLLKINNRYKEESQLLSELITLKLLTE